MMCVCVCRWGDVPLVLGDDSMLVDGSVQTGFLSLFACKMECVKG